MERYFLAWCLVVCLSVSGGLLAAQDKLDKQTASEAWSVATLRQLTLREKIAQMLVYRVRLNYWNYDSPAWAELKSLLQKEGIGHLYVWRAEPVFSLHMVNALQVMSKIPMLVQTDLEPGLRLPVSGETELPPAMAITATGDTRYAYEAGKIIAMEGRAIGIHLALAPVVDVNNNPANPIINTRSFGEDAESVALFANAFIAGLRQYGMAATVKHFPGHGDTQSDSHSLLATIPSNHARLWSVELLPFQKTVQNDVELVMIGHLHAPEYQPLPGRPATLSAFWIGDVLRQQMHFSGLVITDAMEMGGITQNFTESMALIETINAGSDIILQGDFKSALKIIAEAVEKGYIAKQRIDEAVLRILELKERMGLSRDKLVPMTCLYEQFGKASSQRMAQEMAARAITLVKNEGGILPFATTREKLYVIDLYDYPYQHSLSSVSKLLLQQGIVCENFAVDDSDEAVVYETLYNKIPARAQILVNVFCARAMNKNRIFLGARQTTFLQSLCSKCKVILNSLGTPYILRDFPQATASLCAYSGNERMQQAAVQALIGRQPISGKLPITIPGIAPLGSGLILPEHPAPPEKSVVKPPIQLKYAMPFEAEANVTALRQTTNKALNEQAWPGGVLLAAKDGKIFWHEAFGHHTYAHEQAVVVNDLFDLASLTKVIATTSAVMKLYDSGLLELDAKVVGYLPQFVGPTAEATRQKAHVTIRDLLTHSAGLPAFAPFHKQNCTLAERWQAIYATPLNNVPGVEVVYSDIGFMLLGKVVEKVSGKSLDEFVLTEIFAPLGMRDTMFNPPESMKKRILPTEKEATGDKFICGHVHDENAYALGGVSGHAGLFSTAYDLAVFAELMLGKGSYGEQQIFKPETVELFTRRANVVQNSSRCLGWDSPSDKASGGVYLPDESFGHTGFTGTSLWLDPRHHMFVILLTNAVHPERSRKAPKYFEWRQRVHSAVYECFPDLPRNLKLEWCKEWREE
jgi:beta-glucosidase-like glycosyl hydrolase/CubicO group peptidase (beta-lactamase class C family)